MQLAQGDRVHVRQLHNVNVINNAFVNVTDLFTSNGVMNVISEVLHQ
jgi:hypothetical protein